VRVSSRRESALTRARTLAVVSGVPASTSMAAALVLAMVAAVTADACGAVPAAFLCYRVPVRVLPVLPGPFNAATFLDLAGGLRSRSSYAAAPTPSLEQARQARACA